MTADPSAWGIVGFLIILLVGIACVSVHYRRKYEELKEHNIRLTHIVSMDMQQFTLHSNRKEFTERARYIKNCIIKYRTLKNENKAM